MVLRFNRLFRKKDNTGKKPAASTEATRRKYEDLGMGFSERELKIMGEQRRLRGLGHRVLLEELKSIHSPKEFWRFQGYIDLLSGVAGRVSKHRREFVRDQLISIIIEAKERQGLL